MSTTHRTTCTRDCPDACGLLATVEEGRITRLQGDPEHPVTRGFLCWRTGKYLQTQYAPERLRTPLWRPTLERAFTPLSWEDALDLVAEKLLRIKAESGPAAIFHYRSGGSLGMLKALVDHTFANFGPVTTKRGDICSGAGDEAQLLDFGDQDSSDLFTLRDAKHILIWGKNVHTSSPHTVPVLKEARARGARLVAIDPVPNRTTAMADAWHQPRPGGDLALALAVGRLLADSGRLAPEAASRCADLDGWLRLVRARSVADRCAEADVPVSVAEDLADRLADGPTTILVGWGMMRRTNGGAIVRALDALAAVTGNLFRKGGGSSFYFKRRRAFATPWVDAPPPRTICEPTFGADVLAANDPPIRAVWITAGNPVVMLPESETTIRALRSRELVVVADILPTDTTDCAHLVLPVATMLEDDDMVGAYGNHWLGNVSPVVPPDGAWTDVQIAFALARRLGVPLDEDVRMWKRRFLTPKVPLEALEAGAVRSPLTPEVLYGDGKVATPDGRVRLLTEAPALSAADPAFPLSLFSISTDFSQSSQWVEPMEGPAPLRVHPSVAPAPDGALATVRSAIGALTVRLKHDAGLRPDVVVMPKGGGFARGQCANAITRARVTDIGEGGALYEEGVRLELPDVVSVATENVPVATT